MALRNQGLTPIHDAYVKVKDSCRADWQSREASDAIRNLVVTALRFLKTECVVVDLVSRVPGKDYFAFARRDQPSLLSRPANRQFFLRSASSLSKQWDAWRRGTADPERMAEVAYTAALAPCLATDLFDRQNKKGPATYFECFIGHVFARELGTSPRKQASLRVHGQTVRLTMDFLFECVNGSKVHLPVKMSSRERVVQAWAHQRLLDGAYGTGTYKGVMVLFSETKLDSRSREVVEICVPGQWLAYQSLLSRIDRIYYFDLPERYAELTKGYPDVIQIKEFVTFFEEKGGLLSV
jgi:hypothetical protein